MLQTQNWNGRQRHCSCASSSRRFCIRSDIFASLWGLGSCDCFSLVTELVRIVVPWMRCVLLVWRMLVFGAVNSAQRALAFWRNSRSFPYYALELLSSPGAKGFSDPSSSCAYTSPASTINTIIIRASGWNVTWLELPSRSPKQNDMAKPEVFALLHGWDLGNEGENHLHHKWHRPRPVLKKIPAKCVVFLQSYESYEYFNGRPVSGQVG